MQIRLPWDPPPVETPPPPAATPPRPRGRRPATAPATTPPWRHNQLTVSGPNETVSAFAEAARGSGIVPWVHDFSRIEEDVFHLAAAQPPARRSLTVAGCHILARQFRERVEAHHAKAMAQRRYSRACPFDLHGLLPVPDAILQLGPLHPRAVAWLAENWGVTDSLRQVREQQKPTAGRRLPGGSRVIGYSFFTAHETPHAAILQLGGLWPALRFGLQPQPSDGAAA